MNRSGLYGFDLTHFLHVNRYPSSSQARGHASLENAIARDPPKCERFGEKIMRILKILRSAVGRKTGIQLLLIAL
jgi:hypothetical protein